MKTVNVAVHAWKAVCERIAEISTLAGMWEVPPGEYHN